MDAQAQLLFLQKAYNAACAAGHIWPEYAACEAALESNWGRSTLCAKYRNLFGEKATPGFRQAHPDQVAVLKTWEDDNQDGKEEPEEDCKAYFVIFVCWIDSFRSRMDVLRRLAGIHPDYALALAATTGEDFVRAVSRTWSSDVLRAEKVLATYKAHQSAFPAVPPA